MNTTEKIILRILWVTDEPMTVAALAEETGLVKNTIRRRLALLEKAGLTARQNGLRSRGGNNYVDGKPGKAALVREEDRVFRADPDLWSITQEGAKAADALVAAEHGEAS